MIDVRELSFSFENKVLDDVTLNFEKGKFYTILGPNGSGKTTLLRLISKALHSEKGEILVEGEEINQLKPKNLAKKIAVVPQNTEIEFDFSVEDIVLMGRTPYIPRFYSEKQEDYLIAKRAMKTTNTFRFKHKSINALSGGEKQRVIIARAIAQSTDVILLDEPISHLDIRYQIEILKEIKEINEKNNTTIIAVLHDLNLAAAFSDYIILMHEGKVYEKGKPEEVLKEETIKQVYGVDVFITKNPKTEKLFIMPF